MAGEKILNLDPIQGLLQARVLSGTRTASTPGLRQAMYYMADDLAMSEELLVEQTIAVRLRLALSLAPRSAISHSVSERTSRYEKVRQHLSLEYSYPSHVIEVLAHAVTDALNSWETSRAAVAQYKDALTRRDGNACANCRVCFSDPPEDAVSVRTRDPFKPTAVDAESWLAPTVDHVEPVSHFGTNELDNLELLCRFCNAGKEDARGPLPKHEFEFGHLLPYAAVEEYAGKGRGGAYLRKVFYMTVARSRRRCSVAKCASDSELTVRLRRQTGLFVLGNLSAVCYDCV